jgi:hypothetical protein
MCTKRCLQHCCTALSYIDGKIHNGSRPLKHSCAVLYKNYVKILILQDGY